MLLKRNLAFRQSLQEPTVARAVALPPFAASPKLVFGVRGATPSLLTITQGAKFNVQARPPRRPNASFFTKPYSLTFPKSYSLAPEGYEISSEGNLWVFMVFLRCFRATLFRRSCDFVDNVW